MSVVVVGKNSFLAGHLPARPQSADWVYHKHADIDSNTGALKNARAVINFAFSPALMKGEYDESQDIDTRLAKSIGPDTQYIMLSTRMVYGHTIKGRSYFTEEDACRPGNAYGRNKATIENSLRSILPAEKLTILRLSNIFGYEPGRHTFFGIALENLCRHKKMVFDHAPETMRDFLPVEIFVDNLVRIVKNPAGGIFNLGSGIGLSSRALAQALIGGYGDGVAEFTSSDHKGEFYLDMKKTNTAFALDDVSLDTVLEYCAARSRLLRQEI